MVYFTCGACGEQVKKPQVEKHYTQKCRNCNVLTCIDCLKDFYGEEYKSHNQCMSEAQRYSKEGREGWDPSQGQGNKGDKKQQEWMGKLRQLMDESSSLDSAVRNIINTIADHDNIPRKRPKFINFVKNIMRNRASTSDIDKTWDLFSQAQQQPAKPENMDTQDTKPENTPTEESKSTEKKKKKKDKQSEDVLKDKPEQEPASEPTKEKKKKKKKGKENDGTSEEAPMETTTTAPSQSDPPPSKKEKKSKKRKHEETEEAETSNQPENVEEGEPSAKKGKFDWDATIEAVLAKKGQMKLKKLRKKCVSEFFVQHPDAHQTPEQIGAKFDKKINKRQKYKVVGEEVSLNTARADPANGTEESTENTTCDIEESTAAPASNGVHNSNGNGTSNGGVSFNAWEAANLGNDAQTEKFRRLMGIKSAAKPQSVSGFGVTKRDDRQLFRDLEQGFEKARHNHFKAKGMGLGFAE